MHATSPAWPCSSPASWSSAVVIHLRWERGSGDGPTDTAKLWSACSLTRRHGGLLWLLVGPFEGCPAPIAQAILGVPSEGTLHVFDWNMP